MQSAETIIIGGGIIGLATAYYVQQRQPQGRVIVLEKEPTIAQHQSGRNSGVLHSGIYYAPNSHKAYHCRYGKGMMRDFCRAEDLPFRICGKVIVAIDADEVPRLHDLYKRGVANGVRCELIDQARLHVIEPYAAGVAAIYIPDAAVVDFKAVAERLAMRFEQTGGIILTNHKVVGIQESEHSVIVQTKDDTFVAPTAVNAAGLYADRLAEQTGVDLPLKIVPFRGEYYRLKPESTYLCRSLIYPVPDPALPFLGVHFTRTLDGNVDCGPNAVMAGSREGYRKGRIRPRDFVGNFAYSGVRKLTRRHLHTATWEMRRSYSKRLFALTLQRLIPAVSADDLVKGESGVRAQAVTDDGVLIKDFVFHSTKRMVHVISAPSPGATSCLSIGRTIASTLE